MQTFKTLIERRIDSHSDFSYYLKLIEEAETNEFSHPDIAIECCSSLFQGLAKTVVYKLSPACDREAFEDKYIHQQVKACAQLLRANDDAFEDEFIRNCETLARNIGALRNARGDISHGRAVPKVLQSDRSLARLVMNMSDAMLTYILATFLALEPEKEYIIEYEQYTDFNDQLDELYPLDGKPLYSRALYDQYYEDYVIRLKDWIDEFEEVLE
jgi:hypothetical protein